MHAEPIPTTRVHSDLTQDLDRAGKLANLLDARFSLAGFRFGLDTIVGLIPAVGDTAMTIVGLYPIRLAHKHKLGGWVKTRMGLNLFTDWLVGLVPLVGDLFDIGFKGNLRNLRLLRKAAEKRYGVAIAPVPPVSGEFVRDPKARPPRLTPPGAEDRDAGKGHPDVVRVEAKRVEARDEW
ncbi:MAG: DUF4112 domain-containing protein [Phycisphaerae bacterium]|nr:DUF4112 domain-containing protein [Tepidisphaeraceae bacterium]